MRLIDSDMIEFVLPRTLTEEEKNTYNLVIKMAFDNAPTVIAIPIDWIHDYLDYTFLPESHFWVIQKMIKEWDKEHEKDI